MKDDTLSRIIDAIPDSVMVINDDFTIVEANKAARLLLKLTGLDGEAVTCHKLLHNSDEPCDSSLRRCSIKEVISTGKPVTLTHSHCIDDDPIHEVHVAPFKEESGKIVQLLMLFRDITERKQAEAALTKQRQKLADILEGTNAGTWDWNVQTGEVTFNTQWAEIMGRTLEELAPIDINTWINNVHPEDLPATNAALEQHFKGEADYYDVVFRQPHKDGDWVWVNARGKVIEWTEDGQPLRMSGTHLNITERKQAEELLRESEKQLHTLLQSIQVAVVVHGPDTSIIKCNKKSQELLELTEEQMLGKKVIDSSWKFLNENGNKMSLENYPVNQVISKKKALKNFIAGVYRPKKKDVVWVLANAVPEFGRDGKMLHVIVTFMDITDRKRAEEQLRESEETKKALLNAPTDTAMLIDIKGTILAVNETGAQRFDSSVDKIVGLHIHQYLPPELAKKRLDQGMKVVSSGKPVLFEDERDGKYFENRVYPIFDNEGTVSKFAIFARDITENKKAQEEREKLVRKLQETLEEVKTLSGLLPICSECKKIRDDKGYWNQLEVYVQDHSEAEFSHGICPECMDKIYGDQEWYKKKFGKK